MSVWPHRCLALCRRTEKEEEHSVACKFRFPPAWVKGVSESIPIRCLRLDVPMYTGSKNISDMQSQKPVYGKFFQILNLIYMKETCWWFPSPSAGAINSAHICMKSYTLKQWQRFMITFEQWSTSWNIYIQSFSYCTAVFYNTFLIQCHLVRHKMPIWNSEILAVPAGSGFKYLFAPFHL